LANSGFSLISSTGGGFNAGRRIAAARAFAAIGGAGH